MNFYSSDFHCQHYNMTKARGFQSCQEMEDVIVENFNSIITKRDVLYHLGDFYWNNDMEGIRKFIARLNCKKLIFLKGNHDKPLIKFMQRTKNSKLELYSDLLVKDGDYKLHLYHYPINDWDRKHHNKDNNYKYLHAFGHQHAVNTTPHFQEKGAVNVNVDMNNYMPLNINDIAEIIKKT